MRRSGFTMIELIFVIVILGILAAVAIPKLTATRDDAKISKGATEIATVLGDVGAFYTAQGRMGSTEEMTNVVLYKGGGDGVGACATLAKESVATGDSNMTTAAKNVFYCDKKDGNACVGFWVSAADGNLTIFSESNVSVCDGIYTKVQNSLKVHSFGGSRIVE